MGTRVAALNTHGRRTSRRADPSEVAAIVGAFPVAGALVAGPGVTGRQTPEGVGVLGGQRSRGGPLADLLTSVEEDLRRHQPKQRTAEADEQVRRPLGGRGAVAIRW